MAHVLPLLNEMRGRVAVYVGEQSLTKLAAFLRGYDYALWKIDKGQPDSFLADFRDWVHQRYGSSSQSWDQMIVSHSTDEADAVKRFWELLDEFQQAGGANGKGVRDQTPAWINEGFQS